MRPDQEKRIYSALNQIRDAKAAPEARLGACDALIRLGVVEPTLPVLHDLSANPAYAGRVRLLQRTGKYILLRRMVNSDIKPIGYDASDSFQPTIDNAGAAHWRCEDPQRAGENLLIVFTGRERGFGISVDLMHRILRHSAGQVIYLHDFHDLFYMAGIDNWGGPQRTLERLKRFVAEATVKKLYILGHSVGGFAALQYALDMKADAVLVFSPPTNLHGMLKVPQKAERLHELQVGLESLDILPAYERAQSRPHVTIVYGAQHPRDEASAKRMAHLPGVDLIAVPGLSEHSATRHLLQTGEFKRLIEQLLAR